MIIPWIPNLDFSNLAGSVEQVQRAGLLGRVALGPVAADQISACVRLLERTGGRVDLLVHLGDPDEDAALELLNAGASQVLLAAEQTLTAPRIPADRIVSFRADHSPDEAVPRGWLLQLQDPQVARMAELEMARIDCLVDAGQLEQHPEWISAFFEAVLVSDREDGLWPTIIVDPLGTALGLAYSSADSLAHAIEHRVGTYYSRSRDELWVKGLSSGATQQLLEVRLDCDRDCLRFTVTQEPPGFCHRETYTCFGAERSLATVTQRLAERLQQADSDSFTWKLAHDADLLASKLLEEAGELAQANRENDRFEVTWEAADVLYFSLVALAGKGVTVDQVHQELARRMNRVIRRPTQPKSPGETG